MKIDPLYWLLGALQTLAAPVLLAKKWRRFRARGDAFEWDLARWKGDFAAENSGAEARGPHLVLVAMGFAETRLAARLTEQLRAEMPGLRVTWSIRNLNAAQQGGAIPETQSTVPFPFDYFAPVSRWIDAAAPDAVVFIERFQFPVLARALHNRGVKVAVVAARSRAHRGGRYRVGGFYARWLLGAFDLLCFRSAEQAENLGEVPASTRICVTGSLKFWPQLPPLAAQRARDLRAWLGGAGARPLVAAGSTQPGDEAWILEAFAPLRDKFGATLLLAPRHVERCDEVEILIAARGWTLARRSHFAGAETAATQENSSFPDVLLLDTLGDLTHAYGAARAAFVGGTIAGTGHNVLEPVAHGIAVFFGPKRGTFAAEQEMCEAAGVGFRVQTPEELSRGWENALQNGAWRAEVAARARDLNRVGEAAWRSSVEAIVALLKAG